MNAFKRKQALSDATRRQFNRRRPSLGRSGIARAVEACRLTARPARKYHRHGFTPCPWWSPDDLNDIAF